MEMANVHLFLEPDEAMVERYGSAADIARDTHFRIAATTNWDATVNIDQLGGDSLAVAMSVVQLTRLRDAINAWLPQPVAAVIEADRPDEPDYEIQASTPVPPHCPEHPVPYPGCASCVPVTFSEDEMERARR
jgi:hypothetical protein